MSDVPVQTFEETVNAFYPDAESEPLEAPTDEALEGELPEEAEEESVEVTEETKEEAEESEASDEEADDVEDVQSVELDGVEHNLTDITEWKEAHDNVKLMQADCTKKWTEAANLKKEAETQSDEAKGLALELEVLVNEDKELDLDSLLDIESDNYDPDKYAELKPKVEKRAAKLAELKAKQPDNSPALTQDELVAESNNFHAYDPKWQKDGQLTEAFQADMKVAGDYLKTKGYSQDEVNNISRSHHWQTIIDASKYNAQKSKVTSIKKKITKTPKATKPAATQTTLSQEEIFYGKK